MRTLLTVPFYNFRNSHPDLPDLALGYLARMIEDISDIRIIDWNRRISVRALMKEVAGFNPDIIGIKCFTINFRAIKNSIKLLREICPGSTIIIGGPHPTSSEINDLMAEFQDADIIVLGEAERIFREMVLILKENRLKGSIKALSELQGILVPSLNIRNEDINIIDDLNSIPIPKWELIDPRQYMSNPISRRFPDFPLAPIMATRGCPTGCRFCSVGRISGRHIRKRDAESIFDEVDYLYKHFDVKQFMFIDNSFSADRETVESFADMILKNGLEIAYNMISGPGFHSKFDKPLLKKMKLSGLESVVFGIESASNKIRDLYSMGPRIEKITDSIRQVKDAGIDVLGFFMIGFPGEDNKDIMQTIDYSRQEVFDMVSYEIVSPYPGTGIYRDYLQQTGISRIDWYNFKRRFFSFAGETGNSKNLYRKIRYAAIKNMMREGVYNKDTVKNLIKLFLGF